MFTLNCKGKIVKIDRPLVMAVINITADSFYKGYLSFSENEILALAKKMVAEEADILDVGGQSTRPGSERLSAKEEIKRIIPVIKNLRSAFPGILISADTYYSTVAAAAVEAGADMINDISSGQMDAEMTGLVASLKVPYICMHMKGRPENMHKNPVYDDVVQEVLDFFISRINECTQAGIQDIIIDPGFGFGKTISHNFKLLHDLPVFRMLEKPILVGLSRKATIYKTLNTEPEAALNGTTVLNTIAIQNGASLLRVHDVKEAKEVISLLQAYKENVPF